MIIKIEQTEKALGKSQSWTAYLEDGSKMDILLSKGELILDTSRTKDRIMIYKKDISILDLYVILEEFGFKIKGNG